MIIGLVCDIALTGVLIARETCPSGTRTWVSLNISSISRFSPCLGHSHMPLRYTIFKGEIILNTICMLAMPDHILTQLNYVETILVGPSLFFPKAAIFLFYLQIFSVNKMVKLGSQIGIFLAFLAYIPLSLGISYYNAPHVGQTWEELGLSMMPIKGIPIGVAIGAASVFVDIYIFVLPLPAIFTLKLSFKKRMQLLALFATAFR
jgi:hypothetical protein